MAEPGSGHHITREDYDVERLIRIIRHLRDTYDLTIYLEPGEAVVLNAGFLVASVMEIVHNHMDIAILDTSAACHMPDVIEMPYRPPLKDSGEPNEKSHTYRLDWTYLSGWGCDRGIISFDMPLKEGDQLIFEDMALYTLVKTNTFNGIRLPDIVRKREDGTCQLVKTFGYEDFKNRLS